MARQSRRAFLGGLSAAALGLALGCETEGVLRQLAPFLPVERPAGPFRAPETGRHEVLVHLLQRLTYGPRPEDLGRLLTLGATDEARVDAFIAEQLDPASLPDPVADWAVRRLETLRLPLGELFEYQPWLLLEELTRHALLRAVYSRRQLAEVMAGFWRDHFNIDQSKGDCRWLIVADDRDVVRRHCLGSFRTLLRASATSPAMLWYLDGRVNRKTTAEGQPPNENYARELMELHTMGVHGGYDQRDVIEVARCLTGWRVRSEEAFFKGRVEFDPELHDDGEKWVLGHRIPPGLGPGDLDRVLAILCDHPATGRFLATKLCRRFIADDPPASAIEAVAQTYRASGGSIAAMLRALFQTRAFWQARGERFKRPFRFVVSALRATGATTSAPPSLLRSLLRMGQAPYQYPTPEGFSDRGEDWLGTLLWRWNVASALADGTMEGVEVDEAWLTTSFGGQDRLWSHLLGGAPGPSLARRLAAVASPLALALASPPFQRY